MLNEKLYEKLEHEFLRCRIGEEVEDVLLELAEAMSDKGVVGREISVREQIGNAKIAAYGTCEEGADGEALEVFIKTLVINGKEYEIEDYLL